MRVYDPVADPGERALAFTGGATQTVELAPETQKRLRALGYLR